MTGAARRHTFIFADLAGYTALTEAHGDEWAADAAAGFVRAARPLIEAHGAEEVKALGDALLIRSADAGDALRLARDLVCELGRRERELGTRVGLHTGTAVQRDGDWFGAAVNVAARVADVAKAGEVLFTAATLAAAGSGVEARPRGTRRFKNVAEPVDLHALVLDGHRAEGRGLDPVCRMTLDLGTAEHHRTYRGVTYAFCSQRCADAFAGNPRAYVQRRFGRFEPARARAGLGALTQDLARRSRRTLRDRLPASWPRALRGRSRRRRRRPRTR